MSLGTTWDVIIVGSGAGGGTVAAALAPLAAAGRRILVLERGPHLPDAGETPDELDRAARYYDGAGATFTADGTIALATGCVVGGSTALSSGVAVAPAAATVDAWRVPGLSGADIERRGMVRAAEAAFLPDVQLNENNRLFAEGALRAGFAPEQLRIHVRGCRGAGVCHLGCPNAAMQGTQVALLPHAITSGVHLVADAPVVMLAPHRVVVRRRERFDAAAGPGEITLTAACIVLAAGALHTCGLLLKAGFGTTLPQVGRGVTCHPSHVVVAEHPRAITNDVGHPTSYRVDRTAEDGFVLEPCFSSPLVTARNLTGFGPEHAQVLAAYPRLQMLRVTARDRSLDGNRIVLDAGGEPSLRYRLTPAVRRALVAGQRAAARIAFGAGAVRVHVPAADPPRLERRDIGDLARRIADVHELPGRVSLSATQPLGGAAMSASSRTGVTDAAGRVHGVPWLRIADGALCPDSPGVHPAITISALAERVAEAVQSDLAALSASTPAVA